MFPLPPAEHRQGKNEDKHCFRREANYQSARVTLLRTLACSSTHLLHLQPPSPSLSLSLLLIAKPISVRSGYRNWVAIRLSWPEEWKYSKVFFFCSANFAVFVSGMLLCELRPFFFLSMTRKDGGRGRVGGVVGRVYVKICLRDPMYCSVLTDTSWNKYINLMFVDIFYQI